MSVIDGHLDGTRVPRHVVILGLGPSVERYLDLVKRLGGRRALADEVWAINALGDVLQCDLVFHMDDVRVQEARAAARPQSNIARMMDWLRVHPGPVMTSRAVEGYPGLVEFPLDRAANAFGTIYFNSTAAYAVAYAILIGVREISLFGIDFTYPNSHAAEKGRACVEFWLGRAVERGILIHAPDNSSIMDQCEPEEAGLYGYDAVRVSWERDDAGLLAARFAPREIPTADEIEARYDHSKHPSPLVSGKGKEA